MKKIFLLLSVGLSMVAASQPITDTTTLRTYINAEIVTNGTKAITAVKLNRILNGYLNTWPNNTVNATSPLSWNAGTRTMSLPGWNAANWNTVYNWYVSVGGGIVPNNRTITINGAVSPGPFDLSANRTWTVKSLYNYDDTIRNTGFLGYRIVTMNNKNLYFDGGNGANPSISFSGNNGVSIYNWTVRPLSYTMDWTDATTTHGSRTQFTSGETRFTYGTASNWNKIELNATGVHIGSHTSFGNYVEIKDHARLLLQGGDSAIFDYPKYNVKNLPEMWPYDSVRHKLMVYDYPTKRWYYLKHSPGLGGGGGGTYTAGPGIDITDNVITNTEIYKHNYFRNTGATGEGVYIKINDSTLGFKKLIAGTNVTITPSDSALTISATGGGSSVEGPEVLYKRTFSVVDSVRVVLTGWCDDYKRLVLQWDNLQGNGSAGEFRIRVKLAGAGSWLDGTDTYKVSLNSAASTDEDFIVAFSSSNETAGAMVDGELSISSPCATRYHSLRGWFGGVNSFNNAGDFRFTAIPQDTDGVDEIIFYTGGLDFSGKVSGSVTVIGYKN